jgi:hypothetical protein
MEGKIREFEEVDVFESFEKSRQMVYGGSTSGYLG